MSDSLYLEQNQELALLSKGVPPVQSYVDTEFGEVSIFVKGQAVHTSGLFPISRMPTFVKHVRAFRNEDIRVYFSLHSWRGSRKDTVVTRITLHGQRLPKAGIVGVVFPGNRQAIPSVVRKARARVNSVRKARVPKRRAPFPRSSNLRPNPEVYNAPYKHVHEIMNNGSQVSLSVTPKSYQWYERIWSGVRTPGFKTLKARLLPVNPTQSRVTLKTDGPLIILNRIPASGSSSNWFTAFTEFYPAPADNPAHLQDAQFKALRNLINKANIGIDANLSQDFAQIGQTVKLVASTCKRLTKAILALKSGNIPGAVKAVWSGNQPQFNGKGPSIKKSVADNWLELQYGWKPLLNDIHGAMNSLAQLQTAIPFVREVTASGVLDRLEESDIFHWVGSGTKVGKHYLYTVSKAKYSIRYKVDDHLRQFLAQTGFTNYLNLGWEILPFSFVIDWFSPIGPYLETLSAWDGLAFVDGSLVLFTRTTNNSVVDFSGAVPQAPGQTFTERGRYTRERIWFERFKLNSFPSGYVPSVKNGLASVTHAANALALMKSAFTLPLAGLSVYQDLSR